MLTKWEKPGADPLLWEKECLPVGRTVKWMGDDKEVLDADIKLSFLQQLVRNFQKFKEVGVRVPFFKTHVEDPDNDRGTVEKVLVKKNANGVDSLFSWVRFHNEKARDNAINCDVSVLCPPKFVDGKGNSYLYPMRHLAGTSKPVVPGLAPFTPVVLSFDTTTGLMQGNPMEKVAAILGLDPTADEATIVTALTALRDAYVQAGGDLAALTGAGAGAGTPAGAGAGLSFSGVIPPVMVNQMKRARESQIDSLISERVLSPALADNLKKRFCSPDAVTADLRLSDGDGETEFDRQLDIIKQVAKDRPLDLNGGRKVIKLGHDGQAQESLTIRNAKARAAAAKR